MSIFKESKGETMAYIRKTRDEYHLLANYGFGHGWEHETTELTAKEGRARLKEYRENAPQFRYKLQRKRVRKDPAHA